MYDALSRRDALRLGTATAALGAVGSLSGCSQLENTVPFLGGTHYEQWLPEPDEVGAGDHYPFSYVNYERIRHNEDALDEDVFEDYEEQAEIDELDLDIEDIDETVSLGFSSAAVILGRFGKADVADELEDNDFEDVDEVGDYTIYERELIRGAVALTSDVVIHGRDSDTVEAFIDTEQGEEDRYVEDNDDFDELVSHLGTGTEVSGRSHEEVEETATDLGNFEGTVASGRTETVDGEITEVKEVTLFDDGDDIDLDEYRDYVDDSVDWEELDDVDVSRSGRAVVVTGRMDTENYKYY